jgi:hypothetical protein
MEQSKMLLRCVAKLFALQPKANAIEAGIIIALVVAALLSSVLAVRDPLASYYDAVVRNFVVGTR